VRLTDSLPHTVNTSLSIMPLEISSLQGHRHRVWGGVIMIKAESRIAVDAIIAEDPFNINGIADYQIVEFTPTMFCELILSSIFGK